MLPLAGRGARAHTPIMSEDFLSRWARRKAQVRAAESEAAPEIEGTEAAHASLEVAAEAEVEEPELTAEEIAALPAIESLDAQSDFTVFLRRGVPAALKSAALRRLWVTDPAIRDFVGEARDYAWDWNIAGDVPGSGPLAPGTDVQGMVRRIFGDRDSPVQDVVERPDGGPQSATAGEAQESPNPAPDRGVETSRSIEQPRVATVAQEDARIPVSGPVRKQGSAVPS